MAPPFCILMAFMAFSASLCFSSELNKMDLPTVTISAAPAILPAPNLSPPFTEISPEIAPLLPSPGGELPAPSGSDIPVIPSSRSPPNPDQIASVGPDFAVSPTGSELMSAAFSGNRNLSWCLNLAVFVGLMILVSV